MKYSVIFTALVLALCGLQSCIWEDRKACPACLTLDFSSVPENVERIYLVVKHRDGWTHMDTLRRQDFGTPYEAAVKKGGISVAAFGNIDRMQYDNGYTVPPGEQADSIYTCFLHEEYTSDLEYDTVTMHKNFIGLHIRVLKEALPGDSIRLSITSPSIGYNIGGEIAEGKFAHTPERIPETPENSGYFQYISRITRQKDSSLSLEISAVEGDYTGTITEIGLSRHLEEAGIDMNAEELGDLYMTVDFSRSTISVSPEDWGNINNTMEIEI